jgi:chemotaxis response regulator CheB
MDVEMPGMTGLQALQQIMSRFPVPVIMVSSITVEGAQETLQALEWGAVDFIPKQLDGVASKNRRDSKDTSSESSCRQICGQQTETAERHGNAKGRRACGQGVEQSIRLRDARHQTDCNRMLHGRTASFI